MHRLRPYADRTYGRIWKKNKNAQAGNRSLAQTIATRSADRGVDLLITYLAPVEVVVHDLLERPGEHHVTQIHLPHVAARGRSLSPPSLPPRRALAAAHTRRRTEQGSGICEEEKGAVGLLPSTGGRGRVASSQVRSRLRLCVCGERKAKGDRLISGEGGFAAEKIFCFWEKERGRLLALLCPWHLGPTGSSWYSGPFFTGKLKRPL